MQIWEPSGQKGNHLLTDRVFCWEVSRVDEVDALNLSVHELVIAQIRGNKGVASGGNGGYRRYGTIPSKAVC